MDLEAAPYVVLDVETTGLSPDKGHRICEVGAIRLEGGKEAGRFHSLVNPQREVDAAAREQHKISDEELKQAPTFDGIAPDLRRFLAGAVIVAQNAPFDLSFLNAEFVRCGMARLASPAVDTIPLARRVRPGLRSYNLDNLALAFRVAVKERHRSIADCEITVEVFRQCLRSLSQRGEVRTLEDLVRKGASK